MKEPLISVIVPIYKVESYLNECVKSIVEQTYRNLEIILVDDGSPDNCTALCDQWAAKDSRIKVVHKPNGGLSSARNAGMDIMTGDYFGFVDSDDKILPDAYEKLLLGFKADNIALTNGMILSLCPDKGTKSYNTKWELTEGRFIAPDAFFELALKGEIGYTAWSKLYRKDILGDLRFPVGRNNEDTYFMFEISKRLELTKCGMYDIPYYVYLYRIERPDSICNSTSKPLAVDVLKNIEDFHQYFVAKSDNRAVITEEMYALRLMQTLWTFNKNPHWQKTYLPEYQKKLKTIPSNLMRRALHQDNKQYLHFLMMKYIPTLYFKVKNKKG